MPVAAPNTQDEEESPVHISLADAEDTIPPSPSTMRSSSPTEWSTSGSSVWEDARPSPGAPGSTLRRAPSTEFVFVDDDDMSEGGHHF